MIGSRPPSRFHNLREITQKKYSMLEKQGSESVTDQPLWAAGRVEERREGTKKENKGKLA